LRIYKSDAVEGGGKEAKNRLQGGRSHGEVGFLARVLGERKKKKGERGMGGWKETTPSRLGRKLDRNMDSPRGEDLYRGGEGWDQEKLMKKK